MSKKITMSDLSFEDALSKTMEAGAAKKKDKKKTVKKTAEKKKQK